MTNDDILLYLHGHGSDATEAAERAARIDPDGAYCHAAIDAPLDLGDGRGRSWFETDATGIDAEGLRAAAGHVVAVLNGLRSEAPDARVIIGGFSQGAAVALAAAALEPSAATALLLHCGFFPDPIGPLVDLTDLPVLVCSAEDDDVVPAFFTDALVDQLGAAGTTVTRHIVPGGHEFGDAMISATTSFLSSVVDAS